MDWGSCWEYKRKRRAMGIICNMSDIPLSTSTAYSTWTEIFGYLSPLGLRRPWIPILCGWRNWWYNSLMVDIVSRLNFVVLDVLWTLSTHIPLYVGIEPNYKMLWNNLQPFQFYKSLLCGKREFQAFLFKHFGSLTISLRPKLNVLLFSLEASWSTLWFLLFI